MSMERRNPPQTQSDRALSVASGVRAVLLPEIATPIVIAGFLGVSARCVRAMLRSGELPGRRIRGRWYVTKAALLRALTPEYEQERPPTTRGPVPLPRREEP